MPRSKSLKKTNFTLVELLVVCAILAVATSFLLQAVARAKHQVNRIQCVSNLRQIGYSLLAYPHDNGGYLIPADLGGNIRSWINYVAVNEAVNTAQFRCLQEDSAACFNPYGGANPASSTAAVSHASYIMNTIRRKQWSGTLPVGKSACTTGWSRTTTRPVHTSDLIRPVVTIYVCDARSGISSADARGIMRFNETDHGALNGPRDTAVRHSEGFNALLGDGHVEYFRHSKVQNWTAARVKPE